MPKKTERALPPAFLWFRKRFPAVAEANERLGEAVRTAGPLSDREVALVKLGIAIGARMEGATHAHVRKALDAGIEAEALEQVAVLACPTVGFPQTMMALGWVRDLLKAPGRRVTRR
jgi:alkylhydroperoxidase/carboxymuconolactone decarboxylase family protein YurZ